MIKNNKKAFTIIEVVLVLAIAGLIFLMVFIALPALQRGQRNTRRRQDMARFVSAVTTYQSANNRLPFYMNGSTKTLDYDFVSKYIDNTCKDPIYNKTPNGSTVQAAISFGSCSDQFADPNGTPYTFEYTDDIIDGRTVGSEFYYGYTDVDVNLIEAFSGAKCGKKEGNLVNTGSPNDFVLRIQLEGGSMHCADNQ